MDETTIVLSSSRAIRHEQLKRDSKQTLFLPNYITMSEFLNKLVLVPEFKFLDEDSRTILLLEASDFKEFSKLQIERNFFTFIKNSSYIFKFFEELSVERYKLEELEAADVYAEYEEHLSILKELYKRYEALCVQNKVIDKIFVPKYFKFNENYAKMHKKIDVHVEGYLTNYEFELLSRCCEYSDVNISFHASRFNTKMQQRFVQLGLEIEDGYSYRISLNEEKILEKKVLSEKALITCESLSENLLQSAFVKKKIYEFISKGYEPENIAVILPNERGAKLLKTFDLKGNLNFAMGESFQESQLYKKLFFTMEFIGQDTKENEAKLERVGMELYLELRLLWEKSVNEVELVPFLESLKNFTSKKNEAMIVEEEIFKLKHLLGYMQNMSVKSVMKIFLQRLGKRSIDDVRGGKITVMGVLESRGISFDAVIIPDFNDAYVPQKSDKDMFLNTKIREIAKLPTVADRENLQKHYYAMLISRAKEVAISYVSSSDDIPSKFLKELGIKTDNRYKENDYAALLLKQTDIMKKHEEQIVLDYSFKNRKISATSLKTYLTCKRKYYHKYIKQIQPHDIPKDMPKEWEIGIDIHTALKELYKKKNSYSSVEMLQKDLFRELDEVCGKSELEKFLINIHKKRLESFCVNEIRRFDDGWYVDACEQTFEREFAGATIAGQIDRIDKKENQLYVLDYKTGSYTLYNKNNFTEATDFQLEFYTLLASSKGNVYGCGYYDLKESKIVDEMFLEEKTAILQSNIQDMLMQESIDFDKCEDLKNCLYCEYAIMCQRES